MLKILSVAGARPNFMKIASIMDAFIKHPEIDPLLVHTGQHYDEKMSKLFFRDLNVPEPDINLNVGSASHAVQTAEIMKAFEPVLISKKPDAVLVVGDVNSTIACGLVAIKMGINLIHVEAGLRSFDRTMPEEINRILTDAISDLLFCSEESGVTNLLHEGIPEEKIFLVGNVMIDTLLSNLKKAKQSLILKQLELESKNFALITLHRPSNVDNHQTLKDIMRAMHQISQDIKVVFPIHPRTRKMLDEFQYFASNTNHSKSKIIFTDPLGYLDFINLISEAKIVLTDSGGIQEETTILKIPCLTLRKNTERPITVSMGTNQIVGTDPAKILTAFRDVIAKDISREQAPPLWDGGAAQRITKIIIERL